MNKEAILTVGCSGSGKTSWANQFVSDENYSGLGGYWRIVERDAIRVELFPELSRGGRVDWTKYKFTKAREQAVSEQVDLEIRDAAYHESNLVISDTNLNPKHRANLVEKLERLGYTVSFQEFDVPLEELYKRNAQRLGGIIHTVVYRQYKQWLDYKGVWKYIPDQTLPKAIALDMDGSLCKRGDRGWYEWDKVHLDTAIEPNLDFALGMHKMGYNLIVFTGRDGSCKSLCEEWLDWYNIPYSAIYIRPEGDNRCDSIIKEEILKDAAKEWNVVGILDDRPRVVRMWHKVGLHCWCVGDPYDEF